MSTSVIWLFAICVFLHFLTYLNGFKFYVLRVSFYPSQIPTMHHNTPYDGSTCTSNVTSNNAPFHVQTAALQCSCTRLLTQCQCITDAHTKLIL